MSKEQTQPKKEVSKARKIYNIISTLLVVVVFVFLVVIVAMMLLQRGSNGDVKLFGYYTYTVLTDSMEDTINVGDVIICKEVDVETLKEEDIITFIAPSGQLKGQNITHRIKEVHRNEDGTIAYFITKGDNPSVDYDEWELSPDNVKAKYVKTSALIGGFRNLITQWYGYVLLIVLPLIVVFVLIIVGFVKDKAKLDEEEKKKEDDNITSKLDNMSEEDKAKLLEEYLANANGQATLADESDEVAEDVGRAKDSDVKNSSQCDVSNSSSIEDDDIDDKHDIDSIDA